MKFLWVILIGYFAVLVIIGVFGDSSGGGRKHKHSKQCEEEEELEDILDWLDEEDRLDDEE